MCKALKVSSFDESTLQLFVEKIDVTCIGKQKLEILLEQLNAEVVHVSWLLYCKICVKQPLSKRPKIGFQDRISLNAGQTCFRMLQRVWLNAGQNYCRMLQREHSAILLTFIKLLFVIKIIVLSIFEWLLKR